MSIFKRHKTIEEILPGFLLEREMLSKIKNSQAYRTHVYVFIDWLNANKITTVIHKIDSKIIGRFFIFIGRDKGLDRPTCERYFLHLRLLFIYAKRLGEVDSVPFDEVIFPQKGVDKSAEVIHAEDLRMLLPEIKRTDPQLFLACMIEYYCFIRPGRELRLLKVGDIDLERGIITVTKDNAKNSKRQAVTIPSQLIEICMDYGIHTADKSLYVFGNKKKFGPKPCSINMMRYRFNKVRDRLGLPKGYKLYSMKHTGATNLHLSGISMRELMDQLRHTKLEATQHYLKVKIGIINPRIRDGFPSPI